MKLPRYFFISIICIAFFSCKHTSKQLAKTPFEQVKSLNKEMETAFRSGNMLAVSSFYADDCHMLSPWNVTTGREEIDAYWEKIENPIDWKLTVVSMYDNEEALYTDPYWQHMKTKPPLWDDHNISLPNTGKLIYELGHSELITKWRDSIRSSHVDFLLVWASNEKGEQKIIIDTYAANGPLPSNFQDQQ